MSESDVQECLRYVLPTLKELNIQKVGQAGQSKTENLFDIIRFTLEIHQVLFK